MKLPKLSCPNFKFVYGEIEKLQNDIITLVEHYYEENKRYPFVLEFKNGLDLKQINLFKETSIRGPLIKSDIRDFINYRSKEHRPSTITVYKSTLLKWTEFEKYSKKEYYRDDINGRLIQDFRLYLINTGIQLSTVGKYIKTIKSYVNSYLLAYLNVNVDSTYRKVKVDREEKNTFEILTEIELENLKEASFYSRYKVKNEIKEIILSDREKLIGQMFFFMCNTGVPYGDLLLLNFTNIKIEKEDLTELLHLENDSEYYVNLEYERIKIKERIICTVPLIGVTLDLIISRLGLPMEEMGQGNLYLNDQNRIQILLSLLEKFKLKFSKLNKQEKLLFPNVPNQSFNKEIKELLKKLGVDKLVTKTFRGKDKIVENIPKYMMISAHSARRTYITQSLRKGVLPDVVMSTTGHRKVQTMSTYHKHDSASINREIRNKIRN
jgi:site-specific recombinase XerD